MKRFLISAAAVALLSTAAAAADIPTYEAPADIEPVATGWDWSGLYGGAFGGYGWADIEVTDLDNFNGPDGDFNYDGDDVYFGSLFGYNRQYSNFVFGIEGEVGRLELEEEAQFPDYVGDPTRVGDSIASIDVDTFGNLSGRLGLAWNNFLIYGKGGFAFADVEVRFDDPNPTGATLVTGTSEDDWLFGYTFGGGVELGFWEKWSVRGEYMYTDLEEISQTATTAGGTDFEFEHQLEDIHTVKLGVTRRF